MPSDTHADGLVVGSVLLVVGLGLLAFVAEVLELESGAVLVIAFAGPLLAYLILSDKLAEIGAGGVNVTFRAVATTPVEDSPLLIAAEETQAVPKMSLGRLEQLIDGLDPDVPVVLTLAVGAQGRYTPNGLRQYLDALAGHPRFRFVVFVDADGKLLAYLPTEVVSRQLANRTTVRQFMDAINAGAVPSGAAVRRDFLTPATTTEDALERMTALHLDAMLVRTEQKRLAGIVERDDVLARLLLAATRR